MASKLTLDGGIALVTGAAGAIGKETAIAFAEAGASGVVLADRDEPAAQVAADECVRYALHSGFRAVVVKVDVADAVSVRDMVEVAVREFGRVDYSVNSAGVGSIGTAKIIDTSDEVFSDTMDANVKGTMLCVREVAKVMAKQEPLTHTSRRHGTRSLGRGSIVNLGSLNSYIAMPGMSSYIMSKHAVVGLTKSAALDLVPHHIRVNAVCPSYVDTPMMRGSYERTPGLQYAIENFTPLRRAASVEEVADYIVFLSGPSASYINGTGLAVDSGVMTTVTTPLPPVGAGAAGKS
ncbi:NAD(P)-binding protein [Xylariomycetidae sp. FL2044]|nr:NAD(P)-binding protein [Xylariomycetidae sp. FL2044]